MKITLSGENIKYDAQKNCILFSLIDKKKGNAILQLVNAYAGRNPTFKRVKIDFSLAYPTSTRELRQSARNLFNFKINDNNVLGSMTEAGAITRSIAEAYVQNSGITENEFADTSRITKSITQITDENGAERITNIQLAPKEFTLVGALQNMLMHVVFGAHTDDKVYDKLAKNQEGCLVYHS